MRVCGKRNKQKCIKMTNYIFINKPRKNEYNPELMHKIYEILNKKIQAE